MPDPTQIGIGPGRQYDTPSNGSFWLPFDGVSHSSSGSNHAMACGRAGSTQATLLGPTEIRVAAPARQANTRVIATGMHCHAVSTFAHARDMQHKSDCWHVLLPMRGLRAGTGDYERIRVSLRARA